MPCKNPQTKARARARARVRARVRASRGRQRLPSRGGPPTAPRPRQGPRTSHARQAGFPGRGLQAGPPRPAPKQASQAGCPRQVPSRAPNSQTKPEHLPGRASQAGASQAGASQQWPPRQGPPSSQPGAPDRGLHTKVAQPHTELPPSQGLRLSGRGLPGKASRQGPGLPGRGRASGKRLRCFTRRFGVSHSRAT